MTLRFFNSFVLLRLNKVGCHQHNISLYQCCTKTWIKKTKSVPVQNHVELNLISENILRNEEIQRHLKHKTKSLTKCRFECLDVTDDAYLIIFYISFYVFYQICLVFAQSLTQLDQHQHSLYYFIIWTILVKFHLFPLPLRASTVYWNAAHRWQTIQLRLWLLETAGLVSNILRHLFF